MPVALRLADPDGAYFAVRLASGPPPSDARPRFARRDGEWVLEIDPPEIQRLEYQLEIEADGHTTRVCDPDNPLRAPGAFGERSVLELPGYAAPAWLEETGVAGRTDEVSIRGRGLAAHVDARVWSPADAPPGRPLRPLPAHDGPCSPPPALSTPRSPTPRPIPRRPPRAATPRPTGWRCSRPRT